MNAPATIAANSVPTAELRRATGKSARSRPAEREHRVASQPAFVLHSYPYKETSLIVEVFSRDYGRVPLIAKGAKRPHSQLRGVLQTFQPLQLGWTGKSEVRTLTTAEWVGGLLPLERSALLCGFYLNELMVKLLARDDPHPALFDHYADAVLALAEGQVQAAVVRAFELLLLREAGLLPALDVECASLQPVLDDAHYQLEPDAGLRLVSAGDLPPAHHALQGGTWLALQQALADFHPFAALLRVCQGARGNALRQPLRQLLHYHSGVRVFQTRQLMLDVRRLRPHA